MRFTKMHGIGNDYVYVNGFAEQVENPASASVRLSDRHFGIGSDGLILICPSEKADFRMDMYNADGSQAEMCGNGIRCVGKYVHDKGLTDRTEITVETLAGIKTLRLHLGKDGVVNTVTVDMGLPVLEPARIPVDVPGEEAVRVPITVAGVEYEMTCVSMGNPHAVIFMPDGFDLAHFEIEHIGPLFEHHAVFPRRVKTEFVRVIDRTRMEMRVWERGSGETLACGTGTCATHVAARLCGLCEPKTTVRLLGGELQIEWDRPGDPVLMTGPAAFVFDGETDASFMK